VPEQDQERDDDDPAADAEQRAEEAGDEADQDESHVPILLGLVDTERLTARIAERPGETALLLDVDGTLAPIVARPEDAAVPEPTRDVLRALRDRYALVACVSGRPHDDAARVVGVDGIVYLGEHGLEADRRAEEWAPAIAAFADSVAWPAERKRLTVSFHYRTAEDEEAAVAELRDVAERALAAGLRPRWGRKVLEVRPPVDADKGIAVQGLLRDRGLHRALYAGDDSTDLDAFRGLDGLDVAVRVAVVSDEGPSELGIAADVVVGGTEALVELLRRLL
jgi:trehalose 6-phosphate phosphatase